MNKIFLACTFHWLLVVVDVLGLCFILSLSLFYFIHFPICHTPFLELTFRVFICHCINIIFSSHHIVSTLFSIRMCFTFHKYHIIHIFFAVAVVVPFDLACKHTIAGLEIFLCAVFIFISFFAYHFRYGAYSYLFIFFSPFSPA